MNRNKETQINASEGGRDGTQTQQFHALADLPAGWAAHRAVSLSMANFLTWAVILSRSQLFVCIGRDLRLLLSNIPFQGNKRTRIHEFYTGKCWLMLKKILSRKRSLIFWAKKSIGNCSFWLPFLTIPIVFSTCPTSFPQAKKLRFHSA